MPTIPDHLSTYGIPQIVTRIADFSKAISEEITPIGIVATKFQLNSTVHQNVLKQLQATNAPAVFATTIKQTNNASAAAEFQTYSRTLKQKYGAGSGGLAATYMDLADEVWDALEAL